MTASRTASFGKRGPSPIGGPVRAAARSGSRTVAADDPSPRLNSISEPQARPVAVTPPSLIARLFARIPWFTLVLSYVLSTRFHAELARATDWRGSSAPGHFTLLAMGAGSRAQIQGHGEWWRLFTQTALHGSADHLAGNIISLLAVGIMLEPMIGIGWFAAIYFTGGFAGALVSTFVNPPEMLSVGASGAVMAMVAALFVLSFHAGARRPLRMRWVACTTLFPSLAPSLARAGSGIDINAHLGGALAGILLGFVMLAFWDEEDEKPPGRNIAALIAAAWVAMTIAAFAASTTTYVRYAKKGFDFIPDREVPHGIEAMKAGSFALVTKYPRDPRAHMYRGLYFLALNDLSDAEPYFRNAQQLEGKSAVMTRTLSQWSKAALAASVYYQGRKDEAKIIAAPLCTAGDLDLPARQILDAAGLCTR